MCSKWECAMHPYLYHVHLHNSMFGNLCWIGWGHLRHGVDLLVFIAAHVISRHHLLKSRSHDTPRPISSHQQVVCNLHQHQNALDIYICIHNQIHSQWLAVLARQQACIVLRAASGIVLFYFSFRIFSYRSVFFLQQIVWVVFFQKREKLNWNRLFHEKIQRKKRAAAAEAAEV